MLNALLLLPPLLLALPTHVWADEPEPPPPVQEPFLDADVIGATEGMPELYPQQRAAVALPSGAGATQGTEQATRPGEGAEGNESAK